jgi:hypothetical protein
MNNYLFNILKGVLMLALFVSVVFSMQQWQRPDLKWEVHSKDRPQPEVINPGTQSTQDRVGIPPSDAVVLFNGEDLSAWENGKGEEAGWKIENGEMVIPGGTGSIFTKQPFGDVQFHIEWQAPVPPEGEGQGRGNSGIKFMRMYEVQILDSYDNTTYPDGQAASVYGQYPPLVNTSRPPGKWQTYDIIFRRPHFDTEGNVIKPSYLTVFHNNVLVQDHVELIGKTGGARSPYQAHPDKLPIMLQDHKNPVRFRNIWVRELE